MSQGGAQSTHHHQALRAEGIKYERHFSNNHTAIVMRRQQTDRGPPGCKREHGKYGRRCIVRTSTASRPLLTAAPAKHSYALHKRKSDKYVITQGRAKFKPPPRGEG